LLGPDNLKVPIIALEIEGAGGETIAHGPSGPLIVPVAEMPAYAYEFAGGVTVPLTKRDPFGAMVFPNRGQPRLKAPAR
jgi:hypothetical protein